MPLTLQVNGVRHEILSDPETPLIYVLRDELKLKGTKYGCGLEQCGACAVLVDGEAAASCVTPVAVFEGRDIVTVEGIGGTEVGARVQAAFLETAAAQCGYCTAGLVVAVTALLQDGAKPDRNQAATALAPHLCRCGAHPRVLQAVEIAANKS